MKKNQWHNLSIKSIYEILESSESGLSSQEADERMKRHGLNILPKEKKITDFAVLMHQLMSPLVYILVLASIVVGMLRQWFDLLIIFVIIFVNTVIGFLQEKKANDSLYLLKSMMKYDAKVFRDGHLVSLPSEKLVPGDIVFIEAGDRIAADSRITQSTELEIIESNLTGESMPSLKHSHSLDEKTILADRENMAYMSTVASKGSAKAIVCDTGKSTQIGHIATLIRLTNEEKTPLQIQLSKISSFLALSSVVISIFILVLGLLLKKPMFESFNGSESGILYTAIAGAVSVIPEGLLIAVTVVLVVGMRRILEKKAIVRKLIATETLGSTSIICTDKTGTLTEGKMKVTNISLPHMNYVVDKIFYDHSHPDRNFFDKIIMASLLCNNTIIQNYKSDIGEWNIIGDSTEVALVTAGVEFGFNKEMLNEKYPRLSEIPFDSSTKIMATLNSYEKGDRLISVKGSPEAVWKQCSFVENKNSINSLTPLLMLEIKSQFESLTRKGLRVIALAYKITSDKNLSQNSLDKLIFLGLIGIDDPVRKEIRHTLEETKKAGIRTVMVTGDHKYTAKKLAITLGMKIGDENIIEGKDLEKMSDKELSKIIKNISIFARVSPHHKLRIINAWQGHGEVVAMTGDGVNDAPALKTADVGIAMNSGTDVAKENADIILLDDNLKTIVDAIREGRVIYENIRKIIYYLLSDNFTEVMLIIGSLVMSLPLPVLPIQIFWINLIEAGLPIMALTLEPSEEGILYNPPRRREDAILNKTLLKLIFVTGILSLTLILFLYIILLKFPAYYSIEHIRTIIFSIFSISTLVFAYSCKSLKQSIFHAKIFHNIYLDIAVIIGILLQCAAIYEPHLQRLFNAVPLNIYDWLIIFGISVANILMIEAAKFFVYRKKHL